MQGIAEMKTYSPHDLIMLLGRCGINLALVSQTLEDIELESLSVEAYGASQFLSFLVESSEPSHQIH
jgi:hypothetical protein